jgi:hypothetical protein
MGNAAYTFPSEEAQAGLLDLAPQAFILVITYENYSRVPDCTLLRCGNCQPRALVQVEKQTQ